MNIPFWHKDRTIFGLSARDIQHHAVLVIILLGALWVFAVVSYSRYLQFATGVVTAVLYVVWGIVHHKLDGDLYFKNMVEYVFIALLSIVILGGIFL
jgi:hypothetical protein